MPENIVAQKAPVMQEYDGPIYIDGQVQEWAVYLDGEHIGWAGNELAGWRMHTNALVQRSAHYQRCPADIPFDGSPAEPSEPVRGADTYGLEARG